MMSAEGFALRLKFTSVLGLTARKSIWVVPPINFFTDLGGAIVMEKTLVLIKPDAFGKGHAGAILKLYEDAGFKIIAAKVMQMTEALAAKHYVEHIGRPYYSALVEFMTSAPLMALVLGGDDVIKKVRELNGATNPAEAADGTVRKLYAESKTKNAVHASDSPVSAAREIPIFFSAGEMFE